MQIRQMQDSDFQQVLSMMETFYASDALLIHPPRAVLERTLTDAIGQCPFVQGFAFDAGDTLAGYGMVAHSYSTEAGGTCVWIEDIYVLPQFRGKGWGTAFLSFVQQQYEDRVVRIRLEAEPENTRAMAVYRKAGYEVLGYTQLVKELEK